MIQRTMNRRTSSPRPTFLHRCWRILSRGARAVGLAAGAVLAAAGAGAYYVYRRTRGRGSLPLPVIDTRTPWDAAIEELDRIERLDLPEYGRFKEHYTLVADAMRVYVHAMYLADVSPVDAIDMTTDETAAALKRSVLDARADSIDPGSVERVRLGEVRSIHAVRFECV